MAKFRKIIPGHIVQSWNDKTQEFEEQHFVPSECHPPFWTDNWSTGTPVPSPQNQNGDTPYLSFLMKQPKEIDD